MPEAATPALSDMVSASDISQTSMFANYGDGSGDQCTLGKLPHSHDSDLDVQKSAITCCHCQSVQKWRIKLKAAIICGTSYHKLVYEILCLICSDTSSVGQMPSSPEMEEDLDTKKPEKGSFIDLTTASPSTETADDLADLKITAENQSNPGIPEVKESISEVEPSSSSNIMKDTSETATPDS